MSYLVKQKIRGKIYVYEATGIWDKLKRQARQKRRYIGVLNEQTGKIETPRKSHWSKRTVLTSGVIRATEKCSEDNHLYTCLKEAFGEKDASRIFTLATYCATENAPMYLYENWAHSNDVAKDCIMSSQYISSFLKRLGENEQSRDAFWRKWANIHGKNRNLVFDISSISTYSRNLVLDEFGYNRDGEALPQINVGMLFADRPGRPLGYRIYPGSIADVSTLENLIHQMKKDYLLEHSRLVLDRGFYSATNIASLKKVGYDFIIPLPLSLKTAKELLQKNERAFDDVSSYFQFNGRPMGQLVRSIELAGSSYEAHIFVDFERKTDETKILLRKLSMVEERLQNMKFKSEEDATLFIDSVAAGMSKLFTIKKDAKEVKIIRNHTAINDYALKFGKLIIVTSKKEPDRKKLLEDYYRRDGVEKFFDTLKNEMDSNRARVRSQENFDGRLFVHMIGLIIYGEMAFRLKTCGEKLHMSFPEMISNLKRLKQIYSNDGSSISSEITKKQKAIFDALKINKELQHCY